MPTTGTPPTRARWRAGWGVLVGWALAAAVAVAFVQGVVSWPDRWNPWAPLWPLETPNALTPFKLARLASDPAACRAALDATPLAWSAVPDRAPVGGCGWQGAVRVSALPASLGAPVLLACPSAVSLAMWEHHVVQPAAQAAFGQRVVALRHFGSYACRDIGGTPGAPSHGRRSEHASANAIDGAGFALADGTRVDVLRDWPHGASTAGRDDGQAARGRFLRAVRDGACRDWSVVLSPDHDAAHRDHLHLDRGASRACR